MGKLTERVDGRAADRQPTAPRGADRGAAARGREDRPRRPARRPMLERYAATLSKADRRRPLETYEHVGTSAHKVVGVGSVGTRAWIVLMHGRDDEDPLFLQAKEAQAVGARAIRGSQRVRQSRPAGRRGPVADAGGERPIPRLVPVSASTDGAATSTCASSGTARDRPKSKGCRRPELEVYARLCAWTLARAHARSGDAIAIGAYLGSGERFDEALAEFSAPLRGSERRGLRGAHKGDRLRSPGRRRRLRAAGRFVRRERA